MRVASYARVSTASASQAMSLETQEQRMAKWIARQAADRVASYVERASGKNIVGRVEFQRMLADLRRLSVDVVVCVHLDRWSRSAKDTLVILDDLRGHGVGLVSLGWGRDEPINVDNDADWSLLIDEAVGAERERRRIARRIRDSFDSRRERGATTANRTGLGMRKNGDKLEPDPETAWILEEADRRLIAGESTYEVARWARLVHPRGWKSRQGVLAHMRNENAVLAGVRTPETHRALAAILTSNAARFGVRGHRHELSGVFRCPFCGRLLAGSPRGTKRGPELRCEARAPGTPDKLAHRQFSVSEQRIRAQWLALVERILAVRFDRDRITKWAQSQGTPAATKTAALQRTLGALDKRSARLKGRRDAALDLYADDRDGARRVLDDLKSDEARLARERQSALAALAAVPVNERDADRMLGALANISAVYETADPGQRARLNRALCAQIGSHPTLERLGDHAHRRYATLVIHWPEVDDLLR